MSVVEDADWSVVFAVDGADDVILQELSSDWSPQFLSPSHSRESLMHLSVSQINFDPEQLPLEASENDVTSAAKPVPLWELAASVTRENVTMGTLNSNT